MEIQNIWRAAKLRWLWLAVSVLLGLSAAALWTVVTGPSYEAHTQLLVTASAGGFGETSDYAYNAQQLSSARAATYAELIRNRDVITRTAARTGQGVTVDEIQDALDVRTTHDVPIIGITVVDSNPKRAASVASNLGAVFAEYIAGLEDPEGVAVAVTQVGSAPDVQLQGSLPGRLALGAFLGLAVGFAAVITADRLDKRIRTGWELKELGVPYLGAVDVTGSDFGTEQDPDVLLAYRRLATAVITLRRQPVTVRMVVTGADEFSSSSTVARGLAAHLAEFGYSTLYIDARTRIAAAPEPRSHRRGFTALLSDPIPVDEIAAAGAVPNLSEIDTGDRSRLQSLLIAHDFSPLIADFDAQFDFVVVDADPATVSPAGVAITPLVSYAVIVAEASKTDRAEVQNAVLVLDGLRVEVLGLVISRTAAPAAIALAENAPPQQVRVGAAGVAHADLSA